MIEHWDGRLPEPQVRTGREMEGVLAGGKCDPKIHFYYMYRNLSANDKDKKWLESQKLRYDITVIPPLSICGEFVKTKGHYHPANEYGTGYPEIYEVLDGDAHFLLQKRDLSDIICVCASQGEKIIIPPDYGHVTINPSPYRLTMANIVSTAFTSEYAEYERLAGAAYYEMTGGRFIKNKHYAQVPELRLCSCPNIETGPVSQNVPLYEMVGKESILGFLNRPEDFPEIFDFHFQAL